MAHVAKRTLLAAVGTIIPRERAAELGLRLEDGRITWGEAKTSPKVDLANGITEAKAPRGRGNRTSG